MRYLERILEVKKSEVAALRKTPYKELYEECKATLDQPRHFADALTRKPGNPIRLISEIKKASPSRGILVEHFNPEELAELYQTLGASAYSILTDEDFFQGHISYVKLIKDRFPLPILRKEFIIDDIQVYQSRLTGADAILLIAAALSDEVLYRLHRLARSIDLWVLVEVHDEWELSRAIAIGAEIIGINNRNLKDFTVSLSHSVRLKEKFPRGVISVSESGLHCVSDVEVMSEAGFDAVLIGEGLTRGKEAIDSLFFYPWKALPVNRS